MLADYVAAGGSLLVFWGGACDAEAWRRALPGLLPAQVAGTEAAPPERPWRIGEVDYAAPPLAVFRPPANGTFATASFTLRARLERAGAGRARAGALRGRGALADRAPGRARARRLLRVDRRPRGQRPGDAAGLRAPGAASRALARRQPRGGGGCRTRRRRAARVRGRGGACRHPGRRRDPGRRPPRGRVPGGAAGSLAVTGETGEIGLLPLVASGPRRHRGRERPGRGIGSRPAWRRRDRGASAAGARRTGRGVARRAPRPTRPGSACRA